ncbi:peritrophin-1-like [Malaya genurostris]|uniref:peritrophin-1-like n=1 Tax=Malaya genurostris TaxID=325434 RepID=UPI0026F3987F|nr:peritrophin-1-like [Malaya genurostris]
MHWRNLLGERVPKLAFLRSVQICFPTVLVLIITLGLATGGLSTRICPLVHPANKTIHLSHPTDCRRFLTCVHGTPVAQHCPPGLIWNAETTCCDWPWLTECSHDDHCIPLPFDTDSVAAGLCMPQLDHCPTITRPENQLVFLKDEDCRRFHICIAGKPKSMLCPRDMYWNSEKCVCDEVPDSDCSPVGHRVEQSSTTTLAPCEEPVPVTSGSGTKGSGSTGSEFSIPQNHDPRLVVSLLFPKCNLGIISISAPESE